MRPSLPRNGSRAIMVGMVGRTTIHDLLEQARARLERLEPDAAAAALQRGDAILVDIRTDAQRAEDGTIPGAVWHPRNVLEWRVDPASSHADPRLSGDPGARLVVVCHEGYQSSLAAATLQDLGFPRATDLAGGFRAWRAAGRPGEPVDT
jgi:rhodanese-related sulfurtransferase